MIQLQCLSFCTPFHNSNKKPQPYKTELKKNPSKHFLFSKTSWIRLEDVFSVTFFHLPRRLQDVFKGSSRRVFKTSSKDVFKTSSRRLQNVFARRLQDVFKTSSKTSSRRIQDVFKTYPLDVFKKTSSRRRLATMSWRRL